MPIPFIVWPLLAVVVIAGLAMALLSRRRRTRSEDAFVEPAVVVRQEPIVAKRQAPPVATRPEPSVATRQEPPVAPRQEPVVAKRPALELELPISPAPFVAASPLAAQPAEEHASIETEAHLADASKEDVAGVTNGTAPVAHRPWLEFGMRPVRAGTSEDEAMVEIELTVGNSGDLPARDVRITTFLLTEGEDGDMEQLLLDHANDAGVPPVTIAAGEGTRVDATLATPKGELGRTFNPVVVADARYRLPDGSEGRTAAAFRIGRHGVEGLGAIGTSRPHLVDDVEAELDRVLERV